ncbi:hypothetical protein [Butyricimonas virosa]|uniref:hypothetical protein n=1 Tax=Butyricimonas virosa TaxID=544645 RepID=UPI002666833F|nr:hypothetical protein [Butyricimonas virosa]
MSNVVMKDVQRAIKECTVEMDSGEYAAFMRELAEWAQTQADMAEYADDIYQHYDND